MKGLRKSVYWIIVSMLMISFFSLTGTPFVQTVYFVSFLMPVVVVTNYYFNSYLIPQYLAVGNYWLFSMYTIYTIIVALYAQAIIIFLSLLLFAKFQTDMLNGLKIDLIGIGLGSLLVVVIHALYRSIATLDAQRKTIQGLENELKLSETPSITVRANRRNHKIALNELMIIESRGDYVELFTDEENVITKEKISQLEKTLPKYFVRIHRSFIVNKNRIQSFNKNMITINDREIPISRTYKSAVLENLDLTKVLRN